MNLIHNSWPTLRRPAICATTWLCLASALVGCGSSHPPAVKLRYTEALVSTNRNPHSNSCVAADPGEQELLELSAAAIEHGTISEPNALDIGAQRLLGHGLYRRVGNEYYPVCVSNQIVERVSQAFAKRHGMGGGRLVEYQLALAASLPHPDDSVVDAVARVAFADSAQQSEVFNDLDIRPYARAVLASFGDASRKYSAVAFREMSDASPMGTGAAQVAAAAGHPDVLPWVKKRIDKKLSSISARKAIPWEQRNRLYELAWAIAYAGESGRKYAPSIEAIMHRQVESKAFPFGMIPLNPKLLCRALERTSGRRALERYSYCTDDSPYEQ
jgi:hypothetical protein